MGLSCETIHQLMVEMEYGEAEAVDVAAVRNHLLDCEPCQHRQRVFRAVRSDLQAWDAASFEPSRINFVPMQPPKRIMITNRWTRGLAVAASFLLGILLTAALVNLRIEGDSSRWSVSTGLWPAVASNATDGSATPGATDRRGNGSVGRETADALSTMSKAEMIELVRTEIANLPDTGRRPATALAAEEVDAANESLHRLLDGRDPRLRTLIQEAVADSEMRQQQLFDISLADFIQALETQRTDDLVMLAGQLGFVEEDTGQQLELHNAAIDYLFTQVASRPDDRDRREPR